MEYTVPHNLIYSIDRANYEQRMAIQHMVFMLTHHAEDQTAEFLDSELFERLQRKLTLATIKRWCSELIVIEAVINEKPKKYKIDVPTAKLIVEI